MKNKIENGSEIKISVRNLVEFILRSGDIDSQGSGMMDVTACQEGTRIHKKIQKNGGANYRAEVPLSIRVPLDFEGDSFDLVIEGRADGIIGDSCIDEIKGMYMDVWLLEEPIPVHLAQAKCYAYIFALEKALDKIEIQMTYCNIETEDCRYFREEFLFVDLKEWFEKLVKEYKKWANWQHQWRKKRDLSIKELAFPFVYRNGQKDLAAAVYRTIIRDKKLYIEAPTGVGKTISTIFPTVKAMGEGETEKIFYLTAKTIARTVAEDTFRLLMEQGTFLKVVTITAKERLCILDKPNCNPQDCERAKGHYDRVNDAVYAMLCECDLITREKILEYSERFKVCPFEMCLDISIWADAVVCDYNYVFDPNAHLRRFFAGEKKQDYVFLIDEAHNLVERAREMYSARINKQDFLDTRKVIKGFSNKLEKALNACNQTLLEQKRNCDEFEVLDDITTLSFHLIRAASLLEEFLQKKRDFEEREQVLNLYFSVRRFLTIYEEMDEKYRIYADYDEDDSFGITLKCMDPSKQLESYLSKGRSAIFFSATLLPIQYYKEQLAGSEEDYEIYAPSPFDVEKRALLIGTDVSTRYSRRNENEYEKIADYIKKAISCRRGNYFVFFPSYQFMNQIAAYLESFEEVQIYMQSQGMTEWEKEEFLENFQENREKTQLGLCVMGGIFSEGIDLSGESLIGAIIVGTGLPMVCPERELFREYYQEKKGAGFEYAYLYNGMNKVLQSSGRVIRTAKDLGIILLLDERFANAQYRRLFPREWFPYQIVCQNTVADVIKDFWEKMKRE